MRRAILTLALIATATAAQAGPSCFVGASLGTTIATSQLEDGGARIDIGANSLQAGPEVGCSFALDSNLSLGALARYDFTNVRAAIDGDTVKASGRWMAAATLGLKINPSTELYGILGVAGTKLEVPTVATANTLGLVGGVGLNLDIGQGPLSAFAEYNVIRFRSEDIGGATAKPLDHVIRAGVRFRFLQ